MFGELVCGPPGSGKTTYCEGKRQFLSVYDPTRPVVLFNLDPANEDIFPYPCDVDIREVVDHRRVMEEEQLGPNGSYLLCAAIMHRHLDWMVTQIETAVERRMQEVLASMASPALSSSSSAAAATQLRAPYLIIDCPGQVEFYVDASIMHAIFRVLQKRLQCSLCSVHLVDAAIAMRDLPTYASACLLSLTTMIDHELPHVNLLSKWDTIPPEEMGDDSEGGASFLNASALLADGGFERLWRQQLRRRRHAHRMAQHFVTSEHPEPQLSLAEQEEEARLEAVDLEKDGGRIYHYTRLLMEKRTALGLEMEKLFEILRVSTDNEARKQASVRLRQIQEQHPEDFLQHTWEHITSPSTPEDTRFFLSTVIIAFVEQSWHHGVGRVTQERFLGLYTQLAISTPAQSPLLTRKIATIVAAMVRRGTNKTQMGETLPPLLQAVVTSYSQHLQESLQHGSMPTVARDLLNIHLLLKEMQSSRIGHIFEHLCAALVEPLSAVFQCCSTGTELLEAHYYYVFLYWLKCSLRIFGRGIFEVMFYPTLLQLLWQLAVGLGQDSNNSSTGDNAMRRIRLLEYGVKVLEKTVVYFPDRLTMLGLPFFVEVAAERRGVLTSDHSLLFLLCSIVGSPVHDVVSEKLVCRSMRLVTSFLSAEDGDEFVAHVLVQWSCSSADTFGQFLRRLITGFLADDVSGSTLQKWKADPERAAAELDVDMDDEDAPMSCAEQLFIALTGSTACGTASLTTAWTVVNELLTDGSAEKVTAGLHAIGIGYYTMASSDTASYLAFLHDKLLPLLYPATMSAVSPFVLRRVVWLIGMWCESVTQTADRQAVLQCLIEVLQQETSAAAPSMTLLLVCLRSVENFISDNNFQTIDVPANFVEVVLTTIQGLLVQVRGASAIKALAGLVHVLVEKSVLQSNGEALLVLFEPPAVHLIQSYEAAAKSGAADGDDDDDDEWQSGADGDTMGSLVALLECLESSVKLCNRDEAIWVLFNSIVVPCTTPEQAVTPLASDDAWELFLTMCRMTQSFAHSLGEAGLHWTLRHLGRDFEMLPLVYRILYTIFAGWPGSVEEVLQHTDVEQWLSLLSESVSAELCSAVVPVLLVVVRRSSGPLCAALCRRAAHLLVTAEDVQGAPDSIFLAMLLSVAVASSVSAEQQVAQLLADVAQSSKTPSDLLEQLVLLLDVSPSELVSRSIGRLMQCICAAVPLSEADAGMVNRALEGIEVASATAVTSVAGHGDDVSERRTFEDQLLELLGDEGVSADASCPHVVRIVEQFSILRW